MTTAPTGRVVLVTGGGSGIGAAIATELGRRGDHVVTIDPLVTLDGTGPVAEAGDTTAERIVAAGGRAQASNVSVTDREAMLGLVEELMATHGRIDAAVNVAGITRPTGFAEGADEDWAAVLAVHLSGYQHLLEAVLAPMAEAGRGHVVGVTSGSGWRAADAGAYSVAKRAVAALTWQLGAAAPAGVAVNAISPIAMTRMVADAMAHARARAAGPTPRDPKATGGLALGAMPAPEHLAPFVAALAGHGTATVRGQVLFAGGSEVAVVDPPRLLEVVRTSGVASIEAVVGGFAATLEAAEAGQATGGGVNPRLGGLFTDAAPTGDPGPAPAVAVISDRPELAAAIVDRLAQRGARTATVDDATVAPGSDGARAALRTTSSTLGGLDAVVVALAGPDATTDTDGWADVLAGHRGLAGLLAHDGAWARAVADHATGAGGTGREVRLVTVTDAASPGGTSRAQAVAQLARAAVGATGERVAAFAVAMEARDELAATSALVGELVVAAEAQGMAGAELVVGPGWLGVRSHPRPGGSIVFGGPALPDWFDAVLEEQCRR